MLECAVMLHECLTLYHASVQAEIQRLARHASVLSGLTWSQTLAYIISERNGLTWSGRTACIISKWSGLTWSERMACVVSKWNGLTRLKRLACIISTWRGLRARPPQGVVSPQRLSTSFKWRRRETLKTAHIFQHLSTELREVKTL